MGRQTSSSALTSRTHIPSHSNFGVQQQIPGHFVLKASYAGRLGRRLIADADASQILDFPDHQSGQTMVQAFSSLETQVRAGAKTSTVVAQPWFEDVLAPGTGAAAGFRSDTALVQAMVGTTLITRGDMSDMIQAIANYTANGGFTGFLPSNVGMPSQFGSNAYLTNMGNLNYHALLLTLDKNMSYGLRFNFNYTFSHSIDNTSLSANNNSLFNNTGFICDITRPRACRGNSDFDVRQEWNSNFTYDLPVGHGKRFASASSRWVDEAIGGWAFSGIPSFRQGSGITVYSDAFLASFDNFDPAIFTGNKNDLKTSRNKASTGVLCSFPGGSAGATKVLNEFAPPTGLQYGGRGAVKGPSAFFFDAGLAKTFAIVPDKLNLKFRADALNGSITRSSIIRA